MRPEYWVGVESPKRGVRWVAKFRDAPGEDGTFFRVAHSHAVDLVEVLARHAVPGIAAVRMRVYVDGAPQPKQAQKVTVT